VGRAELGLGCWALGGRNWGGQSRARSRLVLEAAYQRGIRHFDTARAYGVSEKLVGEVLGTVRDRLFLASKVYPPRHQGGIRERLCRSLEALGTDRLDLCYLHWPVHPESLEQQVEELDQLREEGLVRQIGVSNYAVPQLERACSVAPVSWLQTAYHAFWRYPEAELLPWCREHRIRVAAYSSLGQGILCAKFPERPVFPQGDHRAGGLFFQESVWPKVYPATRELAGLAERAGCLPVQLALAWCRSQPDVSVALAGARSVDQLEAFLAPDNQWPGSGFIRGLDILGRKVWASLPPAEHPFGESAGH